MDLTISERLAVVETKLDTLQEGRQATDAKVQAACDYILEQKTRKAIYHNVLAGGFGVVAALGTIYKLFGAVAHK